MNKNGLAYAIIQYFTIDEKPRLYKKNNYFFEKKLTIGQANILWIVFTILAMAISIYMVVSIL